MALSLDHDCELVAVVEDQQQKIEQLLALTQKQQREIDQLKKALIGPKTERLKMPAVADELGREPITTENRAARRREQAAVRGQIQTLREVHRVPDDQRSCPKCGNTELTPLGEGTVTSVLEYVPAHLVRVEHVQEKLRCRCGEHVVTAPGAPKVIEQGRYGASFLAHLVTAKCVDSIPIYRIEKDFKRRGLPITRSTMNGLFHRSAKILEPLSDRLLEKIRHREVVLADETRMRLLKPGEGEPARNGFYWTFLADDDEGEPDVAFVFAGDRSAETPREVLGGTTGTLLVDAYAGYNEVTGVDGRGRAACHAHLRRYFHEALATEPVAREAINLILEIYRVEHEAKARRLVGTESHLELRCEKARPARDRLKAWLDANLALHPPKSPIGVAIRYALNHWQELGRFLDDAKIPIDNNASERSLRRVALGRKNFLFVGTIEAGESIGGLYSLVATCEARGINPYAYLADVLARVGDHPQSRLDDLLPGAWAKAQA